MAEVVLYAPGAGRGHTNRVAAIVRHLDAEATVLITEGNSQPLDAHGIGYVRISTAEAAEAIAGLEPRVLVVDCFAQGWKGELRDLLPTLTGRKVLLWHRLVALPGRPPPRADPRQFDLVLVAERGDFTLGVDCEPILVRDAEELLPPQAAREALGGAAPGEPIIVAVLPDVGSADIEAAVDALGDAVRVVGHYPLLELMNGIDGLIGTAGYNLFHEATACGVPARWFWRERAGDQRMRAPGRPPAPQELRAWAGSLRPRCSSARYRNGAPVAAWHIERLLR